MASANERQVGGDHYKKHPGAVQHWDFVSDAGLGYHDGMATKYLDRFRDKAGKQDLEKAGHYCQKCGELGLKPPPLGPALAAMTAYQSHRPDMSALQLQAIGLVLTGAYDEAKGIIAELILVEYPD